MLPEICSEEYFRAAMNDWMKNAPVSIRLIKGKQNNCYIKYSNSASHSRHFVFLRECIKSICKRNKQPINKMAIDFQMDLAIEIGGVCCCFCSLVSSYLLIQSSWWRLMPVAHIKLFQLRFSGILPFFVASPNATRQHIFFSFLENKVVVCCL